MSNGGSTGTSGIFSDFETPKYEKRQIVIAEGLQFHESDYVAIEKSNEQTIKKLTKDPTHYKTNKNLIDVVQKRSWSGSDEEITNKLINYYYRPGKAESVLRYLEKNLWHLKDNKGNALLDVSSNRKEATYKSIKQGVIYNIKIVHKKSEFKEALETEGNTEGNIVIYAGHARYGRGACFAEYRGSYATDYRDGDVWEDGTEIDPSKTEDGLFRMGFYYVPIPVYELKKHKYHFRPVPVTSGEGKGRPLQKRRPPYNLKSGFRLSNRKKNRLLQLPLKELEQYVRSEEFKSDLSINKYWGFKKRTKKGGGKVEHFILHAGWKDTKSSPNDYGATKIRCKTFCHFGCNSKINFREIVRNPRYKGGKWPQYSFFTTASGIVWDLWVFHLLTYHKKIKPNIIEKHWRASHYYAARKTNDELSDMKGEKVRKARVWPTRHKP
jgi:hypothetical protein